MRNSSRGVEDGCVTDEVKYLSAMEEQKHTIAQANATLDSEGRFVNELDAARKVGDFMQAPASYTQLRAHATVLELACRLPLAKK